MRIGSCFAERSSMDSVCRNRCLFCFVDHLPKGLRPSLYVKDDDYRLSFLQGTFISNQHGRR